MAHLFFVIWFILLGRWPSGQWQQTVNLPANAYGGSNPSRPTIDSSGSSSVGRASAFQAEGRGFESRLPLTAYIAQAVEHFLGKEEVTSSSLVVGSKLVGSRKFGL